MRYVVLGTVFIGILLPLSCCNGSVSGTFWYPTLDLGGNNETEGPILIIGVGPSWEDSRWGWLASGAFGYFDFDWTEFWRFDGDAFLLYKAIKGLSVGAGAKFTHLSVLPADRSDSDTIWIYGLGLYAEYKINIWGKWWGAASVTFAPWSKFNQDPFEEDAGESKDAEQIVWSAGLSYALGEGRYLSLGYRDHSMDTDRGYSNDLTGFYVAYSKSY